CYVEIVGPPNFSLTGYSLKFINGGNGADYTAPLALTGQSTGANGYFVLIQDASVVVAPGANSLVSTKANLENGPDNLQLLLGTVVVDAIGYGNFGAGTTFAGEGMPAQVLTASLL